MLTRRELLAAAAAAVTGLPPLARASASLARPTAAQLRWQRDEFALFFHFGVNTFTDREWGDGTEHPAIFDPDALDASQWARAARDAGARAAILTAKHHDGFCLWPSATTKHTVAASPFRGGNGDVVHEFVDACRRFDVRPGLYLSPWDRNHPAYGDSPRYNDVYVAQLTELLSRYGSLAEIWFDGANGEGPNGKRQVYDWQRIWSTVRRLQRGAVIFSDAGPDVRWCGNETGNAGDPNWSTVDPSIVTYPGATGAKVESELQHGTAGGTAWRPAEVDVSIRPGWFHHAAEDAKVRSGDNLLELYCSSVGRNGKLLLNVPPTRHGLLHSTDVQRLLEFRTAREQRFAARQLIPERVGWRKTGTRSAELDAQLRGTATIDAVRLEESIEHGQRIARWTLDAANGATWRPVAAGETIGYARIERFPPQPASALRLTIVDALDEPQRVELKVFGAM